MFYPFPPSPSKYNTIGEVSYWAEAFPSQDIQKIEELVTEEPTQSTVRSENTEVDLESRNSKNSWIPATPKSGWLYDRVSGIIRSVNSDRYNFDLWGFTEHLQYTVYEEGQYYDWHYDSIGSGKYVTSPRKLSFSIQLSDPDTYEGGDLIFKTGRTDSEPAIKTQGHVIIFPSYLLHKVTPVTKGTRKSLVGWVSGPAFK